MSLLKFQYQRELWQKWKAEQEEAVSLSRDAPFGSDVVMIDCAYYRFPASKQELIAMGVDVSQFADLAAPRAKRMKRSLTPPKSRSSLYALIFGP